SEAGLFMHCEPNSMSQPVAEIVAISGIPDEVTSRRIDSNRIDSRTYFILRCKLSFTDCFVYLHKFGTRCAGNPCPGHIRAVGVEFGAEVEDYHFTSADSPV